MTFEKKCLIEPNDIVAVQYECGNCHAAILVPIEKINPDQVASIAMAGCSYCQTPSGFQRNTSEMTALLDFNVSLRRFAELSAGRNLKLRLDIKCVE
jgi:hypothetical protein